MKKILFLFLTIFLFVGWSYWKGNPDAGLWIPDRIERTNRIVIKFYPGIKEKDMALKTHGLEKIKDILKGKWTVARVPERKKVSEVIDELLKDRRVVWAEPDHIAHIAGEVLPNDSLFGQQWYLKNRGTIEGSIEGADVKATFAWDYTKGSEDVIVAVVDTGVDYEHPDLKNKVIKGYDFVNIDSDPMDDNGHGTMVAGIIGAETNNGEGIAGVCWNCRVLAVKVLNDEGLGYYSWIADGIQYAVEQGARVVNLSLGGSTPSFILEDALSYATNNNAIVVAAAGNESSQLLYPAAYSPKCISVGATDYSDLRAYFSNFGPNLDIAAPGVEILSTFPGNNYAIGDGTSFAAPIVSGAVGLLISLKPNLTPDQIRKAIIYTADDVNSNSLPGFDYYLGYGRLNLQTLFTPLHLE